MPKEMFSATPAAKAMCVAQAAAFVALLVIGLAVDLFAYAFEPPWAYAAGLALGSAVSVVKIIALDGSIVRAMSLGKRGAGAYIAVRTALRYLATAGALLCAIAFPRVFGLVGVIAGVLSMVVAALATPAVMGAMQRRLEGRSVEIETEAVIAGRRQAGKQAEQGSGPDTAE